MFEKKVFLLFAIATAIAGLAIGCSCERDQRQEALDRDPPPGVMLAINHMFYDN